MRKRVRSQGRKYLFAGECTQPNVPVLPGGMGRAEATQKHEQSAKTGPAKHAELS
jgi:hypothetical protein